MTDWFREFDERLWLKTDQQGAGEAQFIFKALHLKRGQSVLDAPCGAGRIAVHIARRGCMVTGIDLRSSFIRRARARFKREGLPGTFLAMDMQALPFQSEFHGIYNWFGSFGYFTDKQDFEVLTLFQSALRPGGRLLIDQLNREWMLRHFRSQMTRGRCVISNRWDKPTQRVQSDWQVTDKGRKKHNHMSLRLYTHRQLTRLFEKAGLPVETTYGDFGGGPYRRGSKRLIVVGRKGKRERPTTASSRRPKGRG